MPGGERGGLGFLVGAGCNRAVLVRSWNMSIARQLKHKARPSPHQRQMRFLAVLFIALLLVLFALAFYGINRWLDPSAL